MHWTTRCVLYATLSSELYEIKSVINIADYTTQQPILMQQHVDSSSFFDRSWNEFRVGFGNRDGNFWLGNERIHQLTKDGQCKLRFDLQLMHTKVWYRVEYSTFIVAMYATFIVALNTTFIVVLYTTFIVPLYTTFNVAVHHILCVLLVYCGLVQHVHCGFYATFIVASTATFIVANDTNNYQLTVDGFSGDLTYDAFGLYNGFRFATHDRNVDNCAVTYRGGFWHGGSGCGLARVNAYSNSYFKWHAMPYNYALIYSQMWLECP